MRIIIAAIVGGIIVFVWSAVAHIVTPLGTMGMSSLPDETHVMESLRAVPSSGMYYFPGMDMTKKPTPEEQKAYEAKLAGGPSGLLIIKTSGGEGMSPRALGSELASNVVAALIAAILVSFMVGSWFKRAFAVALFGVFGVVSLLVSYWIWYHFPTAYVCGELVTEVVGWFLAGLAIAKIVRPPFGSIVPSH
jgi:hypothetical protein